MIVKVIKQEGEIKVGDLITDGDIISKWRDDCSLLGKSKCKLYLCEDDGSIKGEISDDALWLKDNEPISVHRVRLEKICYDSPGNYRACTFCHKSKTCGSDDYIYRVKGPCGHWH